MLLSLPGGSVNTTDAERLVQIRSIARTEVQRLRGQGLNWKTVQSTPIWQVYLLAGGK